MQTEPIVPASTRASFTFIQCDFQDFRLGHLNTMNDSTSQFARSMWNVSSFFSLLDVFSPQRMVQVILSSFSRNIIYTSHMENSENINSLNPFSTGNFLVSVAFQIILIIAAIVHRNYLYERIEIERNNISLLLDLKVSVKFQNQMNYSLHWTLDIACQ